jgi:Holliday junction DNA helicase RuvB
MTTLASLGVPMETVDSPLKAMAAQVRADIAARASVVDVPQPINADERSHNPLRPAWLEGLIGQPKLKRMLRRVIDAAIANDRPLDHVLLSGSSGTGKTTIAQIIAAELGVNIYQVEAPVGHDTLLALREVMQDKDVLLLDEAHLQSTGDRRGATTNTSPEVLYNVLEDRTIISGSQTLPFPKITMIAATTDVGLLPEPLLNRLPLKPVIEAYSEEDMQTMALYNGDALDVLMFKEAAWTFARASRGIPRLVNSYVRNALSLASPDEDGDVCIWPELAEEVVIDLNGTTLDGLTADMTAVLRFLYTRCERVSAQGETIYTASVSSLATATGHSRDAKAIVLHVEPELLKRGLLAVGSGGRRLTDAGIERAQELEA